MTQNLHFSQVLTDTLKNMNSAAIIQHYKNHINKFSKLDGPRETILTITDLTSQDFEKHYLSQSKEQIASLFIGFDDDVELFYFESTEDDGSHSIVALRANSEEELLRLFDPRFMVLL